MSATEINRKIKFNHGNRRCDVEGCLNRHYAKGLCNLHYQRLYWKSARRAAFTKSQGEEKKASK